MKFRQLVDEADHVAQEVQDVIENNLYFTDEIRFDSGNSIERAPAFNFNGKLKAFGDKAYSLIRRFSITRFLSDLFIYLSARTRVFFVLGSVFGEVVGSQLEVVKRMLIRRMFWGRSSLFRFSLQFFTIFLVMLVFMSGTYRTKAIEANYQIASQIPNVSENKKTDTFVQNSSTKTQINTNAGRFELVTYIVKGGDTLSTIASQYDLNVQTLLWANDLTENDFIRPGMELVIPWGDGVVVEIKSGDTIETLATKYEINGQLIVDANLLAPPYVLEVGQKIFLPDAVMPAPPAPPPVRNAPIYSGITSPVSTGVSQTPNTGGSRWLGWPSTGGRLTQCFSGWHNGIDIADRSYPAVVAAAPGTVTFSGCQSGNCPPPGQEVGGWGLAWTVIIDHGNGYSTVYGHLNSLYVTSGQSVSAGQAIGQMGQSGLAYGIHVHFMVVYSGTWSAVNPAQFMTTSICGY
ncbi:M23 family metallopeptidase [Candidatus Nomurabacteria bacterium]|nr:M23 family metallopeptidase [Candidatus Nomurabacteria bacterium]